MLPQDGPLQGGGSNFTSDPLLGLAAFAGGSLDARQSGGRRHRKHADGRVTRAYEIEFSRGARGKVIDHLSLDERTAVVDADDNRPSVLY